MSENTMVMGEDGKKVKKKEEYVWVVEESFALSEEEKAAFEQRRRGAGRIVGMVCGCGAGEITRRGVGRGGLIGSG